MPSWSWLLLVGCPKPEPGTTDLPTGEPTADTGEPPLDTNSDADCLLDSEEATLGTDPLSADSDADGLDDCVEVQQHGTDPLSADSDADGMSDLTEVDCVSDPADGSEVCYTCGWPHGDPGTLVSSGPAVGSVVNELTLWDQCEEQLSIYDFYGSYVVMYITTMWCAPCLAEVPHLGADIESIAAETGQPVLPLVALFQDQGGDPPQMDDGAIYAEALALSGFPVTADLDAASLLALPYDGSVLPGKCLLSPELVILGCLEGEADNAQLATWIAEDALSR